LHVAYPYPYPYTYPNTYPCSLCIPTPSPPSRQSHSHRSHQNSFSFFFLFLSPSRGTRRLQPSVVYAHLASRSSGLVSEGSVTTAKMHVCMSAYCILRLAYRIFVFVFVHVRINPFNKTCRGAFGSASLFASLFLLSPLPVWPFLLNPTITITLRVGPVGRSYEEK